MKKLLIVLALLLVFSILYSCSKTDDSPADTTTEDVGETTAPDTSNRISQSTLPPIDDGDGDGDNGGSSTPMQDNAIPKGSSDFFVCEPSDDIANRLTVTEDGGFGGEIH